MPQADPHMEMRLGLGLAPGHRPVASLPPSIFSMNFVRIAPPPRISLLPGPVLHSVCGVSFKAYPQACVEGLAPFASYLTMRITI